MQASIDLTSLIRVYPGKWVALLDDQKTVVASNESLKRVLSEFAKKSNTKPTVFKVPSKPNAYVG